jgi:hypothetical protein
VSYARSGRPPQVFVRLLGAETHDDDPWAAAGCGESPLAIGVRFGTK